MDIETKKQRLAELREEAAQLEREIESRPETWQHSDQQYYGMYHATAGLLLGSIGAIVSLLFNIVGSLIVQQNPLQLIKVYLTFPLGEKALSPEFDTGMAMAIGCCLYVGTGMLLGIPIQMAIAKFMPDGKLPARLLLASALGLIIWAINFYGILAWLQPALFGGNWVVDPDILPTWVAAATHLVFAWTMAYLYPWGKFEGCGTQEVQGSATAA